MQGAVSSSITTRGSNDFVEMPVDFESGENAISTRYIVVLEIYLSNTKPQIK